MVVGGTTDAFMPDNGVNECAAGLVKRYFLEQRTPPHGVFHQSVEQAQQRRRLRTSLQPWPSVPSKACYGPRVVIDPGASLG